MGDIEHRVKSLEDWRHETEIRLAEDRMGRKHLDKRFDELGNDLKAVKTSVDEELKEIKGALSKVAWVIIGGFVAALVAFVTQGGLNIGS